MKQDINLINTRWDLTPLYSSIYDENIQADINKVIAMCDDFQNKYKGKLDKNLEEALKEIALMDEITTTIFAFFYLHISRDATNGEIRKQSSIGDDKLSFAFAKLAFFDIEVGKMSEKDFETQIEKSEFLTKHKPYLLKIRKNAKYQLSETLEAMLSKLSPFLEQEWDDMLDEKETTLKFKLGFKTYNLSEILNITTTSKSAKKRKKALDIVNGELKNSGYQNLRSRALNIVMGHKNLMDKERGFNNVLESRNIANNLDNETIEILHKVVGEYGKEQGLRYYRILKNLLGKKVLNWADRNAPLPFESNTTYTWDECKNIVFNAYNDFSKTLSSLIQYNFDNNRIDAPIYNGKTSGAYNYSICAKDGKVYSWTFLNYLGTTRDIMTLAHELGHSVHGLLAGKKQGVLQMQAPMAYAETASIFGEMLTFEYLLKQTKDKKEKLVLLLNKANDWINSVNRQISFSNFEQLCHEQRKASKLTTKDFNDIWLSVSKNMYGEDGDIFNYDNTENLWCYVSHFMRPFYVYSYAFGELFTQSLFAVKNTSKENFEKLYIEMLESGNTKDAIELMHPFGLDPRNENFWKNGINVSIKKWLDEAEILMMELKL